MVRSAKVWASVRPEPWMRPVALLKKTCVVCVPRSSVVKEPE
jgi:L-lactate utilization protein LutC